MRCILLAAVIAAAGSAPAFGQAIVLGDSEARSCYLSAEHGDPGRRDSIETCRNAIDNPQTSRKDRASTYVNMGILLARADRERQALDAYNNALEINPELGEAYQNRAVIELYRRDQAGAALADFNRAIELGTNNLHAAYLGRGLAHEELGDLEMAYDDLQTALELRPDWEPVLAELDRYTVHEEPRS